RPYAVPARRARRLQDAVEAHDAADVGTAPGEVEHAQPAEAEADGGRARRIDLVLRPQALERELHAACEQATILHERPHERPALLDAAAAHALAVEIQREAGVAQLGQCAGLAGLELAPAPPGVRHQHARARPARRIVARELALEQHVPVPV